MNLQDLLQLIPARVRQWLYVILMALLLSVTFFGWPTGNIGEGIVGLAGALGLVVATANVNRQ